MTAGPSTTICARGCTLAGRHAKGVHEPCGCRCHASGAHPLPCDVGDGSGCYGAHRAAEEGCRGCLPRPAASGLLCQGCVGRLTRMLLDVGDLVAWIRDNVVPGTWLGGRDDWLAEAPAPLSLRAVDDADTLHALLWAWATAPAFAGLVGPDRRGTAIRPMAKRVVAGAHRAACQGGDACPGCAVAYAEARVVGLRAQTELDPTAQAVPTHEVSGWLLRHLERLVGSAGAGDAHDELVDAWRGAAGRWPRAQRDRKLPIPCPSCDRLMLWLHPPIAAEHPITIVCRTEECGRVLTEADYYWRVHELHAEISAA